MNTQNEKSESETAAQTADGADDEAVKAETEDRKAEEAEAAIDAADADGGTLADADAEADAAENESPWAQDPAARIAELEEEIASVKDQFLRFMAEAENVRKRSERHLAEAHKYGVANFARAILTVADDLSRALSAVPEDQRQGEGLFQTLLGGVEAVERELVKVLDAHNIERIDPAGEPFDPNFHEAMFEVPDSDFPSGTVVQVIQPGYRLHDRLLRPARVGVAKGDGEAAKSHFDTTV
ncbi:MAG: nucleotide exchange factor GrpE [Alphaproteobacteria bacterium]|nr:nucleotide exchange factor GrpE [Alphaproteobacteria bacterium]MCZ6847182.1 nucleotide exchange factor GrpE [Alphaproteobacteria bacterium]